MPVTIVESDAFPTTLTAPAAGESASAPGLVSQFLQGIANRSRWIYNRLNRFEVGGTFNPTGDLTIGTASTKTLRLNGFQINSALDNGDAVTFGTISSMHKVAFPDCSSTGTKAIPYDVEHVFPGGFGAPMTSGVIWQVATPPSGSLASAVGRCWVMTLVNPDTASSVAVKDAGGSTLATLISTSGNIRGVTIAFDGSSWKVIGYAWRP
jgi:hypothetical protein